MADPAACIIVTSTALTQSPGLSPKIERRWRSYDAQHRIVRDISVDEQGHALAREDAANTSTYTELDQAGRALVRAVEAGGGQLKRSDDARDGRGNVISHRQTLSALRDLTTAPREAPSVAYDFINHYDSAGLLQKHNRTDTSLGISYSHDANGRCELIVDDLRVEHREYDAQGRLGLQTVDPLNPDAAGELSSSVTLHRYDDQGRPLAVEQDGGGSSSLPIDGQPDIQTLWSYSDDGSVRVDYIDFSSDAPNDSVERNGELLPAQHRSESWSPGCVAVQASIPAPEGSACVAD